MRYPNGRLIVFAKAPVPGTVKTRLIPALGADGAAALAGRLIARTLDMAWHSAAAPLELHVDPDAAHPFFLSLAEAPPMVAQQGSDLGKRMHHALTAALRGTDFAVLIGTDCPGMDGNYLQQACAALAEGCDAVLGPAEDGGYVLIGVRRPEPALFAGVEWGSDRVLAQTRARIAALGWKLFELPTLWDLDRPEDLARPDAPALLSR